MGGQLVSDLGRVAEELNAVVADLREICLRDRAQALAGSLEVNSPPGAGTLLVVRLPM